MFAFFSNAVPQALSSSTKLAILPSPPAGITQLAPSSAAFAPSVRSSFIG